MSTTGGVRDAVWDFVPTYEHENEAMTLPIFNIAKSKKQLGCSDFQYPTATHTRASHMIGVMHRSSELFDLLGQDFLSKAYGTDCKKTFERTKKVVRLAGLYHDIGHGPFSHVCDDYVYSRIYNVDHHGHDIARLDLLKQDDQFLHLLEKNDLSFCDSTDILGSIVCCWKTPNGSKLTETQPEDDFLHALVQGPLGADRQDYFERDGLMTHFPGGSFSSSRLSAFLRVVKWQGNVSESSLHPYRLGILDKGLVEIYNLSMYRMSMFHNVYQNPQVVAPSILIGMAVKSSAEQIDWELLMKDHEGFCELTDESFVRMLRDPNVATEASNLYADDFFFRRNIPTMIQSTICHDMNKVEDEATNLLTNSVRDHKNKLLSFTTRNDIKHNIIQSDVCSTNERFVESGLFVHRSEIYQLFELDRMQKNDISIVRREENLAVPIMEYFDKYAKEVARCCPHGVMIPDYNLKASCLLKAFLYRDYDSLEEDQAQKRSWIQAPERSFNPPKIQRTSNKSHPQAIHNNQMLSNKKMKTNKKTTKCSTTKNTTPKSQPLFRYRKPWTHAKN